MTLLSELEKATGMLAVSASVANALDANIFAGRCGDDKVQPLIVCVAESGEKFIERTAIYKCNLSIKTEEKAQDTSVTSSFSQTIYDAYDDREAARLKLNNFSSGSIYVYDVNVKDLRNGIDAGDKTMVQELNLEIIAALQ